MADKRARSLKITLQLVGPILRQIVDDSPRPPREVAFEHISLWLTATQLHLYRFRRSLSAELKLFTKQGPTRKFASQRVRIDEHMLLASASNLEKALKRFSHELPELSLPSAFAELLHHLRNVYEHWEDYMPHVAAAPVFKGSGKKVKELNPIAHFWSIEIWPGQDVKIARVLSLRELHGHLRALANQLRKLESLLPAAAQLKSARHQRRRSRPSNWR